MEGSLAKSGVWGYFDIATNGVWNKEGCATTPTICKALEEAGLGVVGKVSLSQIRGVVNPIYANSTLKSQNRHWHKLG